MTAAVVTIVRHDTPPPTCLCGAALRLRTSLATRRCCCCRQSCPSHATDEACRLCSRVLWDFDGPGELCLRCQSVAA